MNTDLPGDESGVSIRRKITPADHYQPYQHYQLRGVQRPKPARKVRILVLHSFGDV